MYELWQHQWVQLRSWAGQPFRPDIGIWYQGTTLVVPQAGPKDLRGHTAESGVAAPHEYRVDFAGVNACSTHRQLETEN